MADKKKLAGSAARRAAQKRGKRGKKNCLVTRNVVTEWLGRIESTLTSERCAPPEARGTHEAKDSRQDGRARLCRASLYYIRGHQASSIEICWWGSDPARSCRRRDAAQPPERVRPSLLRGEM